MLLISVFCDSLQLFVSFCFHAGVFSTLWHIPGIISTESCVERKSKDLGFAGFSLLFSRRILHGFSTKNSTPAPIFQNKFQTCIIIQFSDLPTEQVLEETLMTPSPSLQSKKEMAISFFLLLSCLAGLMFTVSSETTKKNRNIFILVNVFYYVNLLLVVSCL